MNLDLIINCLKQMFRSKLWQSDQVVTDLRNTGPGIPPIKSLFINADALENNSDKCQLRVILEKRYEDQRVIEEIHYLLLKSEDFLKIFLKTIYIL